MSAAPVRFAAMGGAYGNVPALAACIADARRQDCDTLMFLGDATGCCGHSGEILALVREHFPIRIAGNHEQQMAADLDSCGCGYENPEDERLSCLAHRYAMTSASQADRQWLASWPDHCVAATATGAVLLCHGSPDQTNEFLYESRLDDRRLLAWLDRYEVRGMICTHTGLPWIRRYNDGRYAVNCGATGKPDHDGDPAVHYALIDLRAHGSVIELRRVEYDHALWAAQLRQEGVEEIFTEPLLSGIWTVGINSLPEAEQAVQPRPLHRHS